MIYYTNGTQLLLCILFLYQLVMFSNTVKILHNKLNGSEVFCIMLEK